jgi:hypothetical protein
MAAILWILLHPMLVQLFHELSASGKILTCLLNEKESIEFGQKCRKEQRWDKDNELKEGRFLIDSVVRDQNVKIEQNAVVSPTVELELAGINSTLNIDNA